MDVRTIAQQLNVANVLEGSVRKSDDRIRITVQLIDAANGYHLWSETYDRKLDDIFTVQDEIAAEVVAALRISLLGDAPRATLTTPPAFAAYLQGLHFYRQRTPDSYPLAVKYLKESLSLDQNYAPAWTLLGGTYSNQALIGQGSYDETNQKALEAVEKALDIDPDLAWANSARGWLAMTYERDYAASAAYFRRAMNLAPSNTIILTHRAVLARTLGHLDEAIEMTTQSISLNPVATTSYVNLADQLYRAGRATDAAQAARKALELTPENVTARANLSLAYLLGEKPEEALAVGRQLDWPFFQLFIRALASQDLHRFDESDEALAAIIEQYADSSAFYIASAYAWKNNIELAFMWLRRGIEEDQPMLGIRTDPFLNALRDDERWDPILAELGLSDEQVAAIDF